MAIFNVTLGELSGQFQAASKLAAVQMAARQWNQGGEFTVKRFAAEKKPTTARRAYKCDCCGGVIGKGDGYFPVARTMGNPNKQTFDGTGIIEHGFRYTERRCVSCNEAAQ